MKNLKLKYRVQEYTLQVADKEDVAICSPQVLFETLKDEFEPVETLRVLVLDSQNKIIKSMLVAKGGASSLSANMIDIVRPIIMTNGSRVALAHNHPSGDLTPSSEDLEFTKKVKKAVDLFGIELIDHLVYSNEDYFSFKKNGLL